MADIDPKYNMADIDPKNCFLLTNNHNDIKIHRTKHLAD